MLKCIKKLANFEKKKKIEKIFFHPLFNLNIYSSSTYVNNTHTHTHIYTSIQICHMCISNKFVQWSRAREWWYARRRSTHPHHPIVSIYSLPTSLHAPNFRDVIYPSRAHPMISYKLGHSIHSHDNRTHNVRSFVHW